MSLFCVSGSLRTSAAEINIGTPIVNMGNGSQTLAKVPKNGAPRQKILDMVEAEPTAWERKLVGYSSAVNMYAKEKPAKRCMKIRALHFYCRNIH